MPKQLTNPKDYVYNLPEGYTLPDQFRAKVDQLVLDQGLSNEEAQQWIDLHVAIAEDFVARMQEAAGGTAEYGSELPTEE